jgi:hypothetical protein
VRVTVRGRRRQTVDGRGAAACGNDRRSANAAAIGFSTSDPRVAAGFSTADARVAIGGTADPHVADGGSCPVIPRATAARAHLYWQ